MPRELLESGCRHFDLRIGIRDNVPLTERRKAFAMSHGLFGAGLMDWLDELATFLKEHPTEMVVLEVKTIESFAGKPTADEHKAILATFQDCLGDGSREPFVTDTMWEMTLRMLLKANKRIYLLYPEYEDAKTVLDGYKDMIQYRHLLLRSEWPNSCKTATVLGKLDDEINVYAEQCQYGFFVLQCVRTPGVHEIVKGIFACGCCCNFSFCCVAQSIRSLHRELVPCLVERLRQWPKDKLKYGAIVMMDFAADSEELVEEIIKLNRSVGAITPKPT